MKLFLALSCYQGQTDRVAAERLLEYAPGGLQLTPGCAPTDGFADFVSRQNIEIRTHHGYTPDALWMEPWVLDSDESLRLSGQWDSLHPPGASMVEVDAFFEWWAEHPDTVLETMYAGYRLGRGSELDRAMGSRFRIAVDVSHVELQLQSGELTEEQWRRIQSYEHIAEIHVSQARNGRDAHRPLNAESFGLAWARERAIANGIPVVLECYMHRLTAEQCVEQVQLIRPEFPQPSRTAYLS